MSIKICFFNAGSEISFLKNGVCQGVALKDLYGRYYLAASMYTLPNQPMIVLLSSIFALIWNAFLRTLVSVLCLAPWLKFLFTGLTAELKMVCPMRRKINQHEHF